MARHSDDTLVLTLVRQAEALLDDLGLSGPFTIAQLCRSVELRRGRGIRLQPHPMPADGPHGMWVKGESDDYVFFDQTAPPLRRLQIIGHELGHILFDDEGRPVPSPVPAAGILNACTRTAYEDVVEQRCEWFGTLVVQRIDPRASVP
jgi:hypothetical protein